MAFNFKKAEAANVKRKVNVKPLAAVVLAPSSGGKSYLMGTFGLPTLFLHTSGEEHGPDAAMIEGGENIFPYPIDLDEEGARLGPDATYKRLLEAVNATEAVREQGFKVIVLDGLPELEQIIRSTTMFKAECLTKEGTHNSFAEGAATLKLMRPVLEGLRTLQRELGVHYAATCLLDVKKMGDDGEICESEPSLLGYKVVSSLVPQFPDQLVVGRMLSPDGKEVHRLQFNAGVTKYQVDNKTKEVKKFTNFAPRLRGVGSDKLPPHMKADMKAVLALKEKEGTKK